MCEALLDVCGEACARVADDLFTINYTVYAMPVDNTIEFMALCEYLLRKKNKNIYRESY